MNKGDKVIYTYFFHPFDIGYGTGYYLFPLNKRQHESPYHLVTSNQSLVEKIIDYDLFLSLKDNGTVNEREVCYVYDYNIRPFSEVLAKKTEQTYSYFESHKKEFESFLSLSADPKCLRRYYEKIEKYSLSYPRIVLDYYSLRFRYHLRKIVNPIFLPFKIITFEICSVFTLYREYTESETARKNEERKLNPLDTEDVKKRKNVKINELRASAESRREIFIKSNRAIIGYAVAIISLLVTIGLQCYSNKIGLILNERINVFQRENQTLKEETRYLNRQIADQQRENILLKKRIEDCGERHALKKGL